MEILTRLLLLISKKIVRFQTKEKNIKDDKTNTNKEKALDNVLKQKNQKENSKNQSNVINKKTELTKEEIVKSLPKFKYHPNLYTNRIVTLFVLIVLQMVQQLKNLMVPLYNMLKK